MTTTLALISKKTTIAIQKVLRCRPLSQIPRLTRPTRHQLRRCHRHRRIRSPVASASSPRTRRPLFATLRAATRRTTDRHGSRLIFDPTPTTGPSSARIRAATRTTARRSTLIFTYRAPTRSPRRTTPALCQTAESLFSRQRVCAGTNSSTTARSDSAAANTPPATRHSGNIRP